MHKLKIHATGCSLIDNLYSRVDFDSPVYRNLLSRKTGDGGLVTGGLVFAESLSDFAGEDYDELLYALTGKTAPDSSNIGGPGIVPVIHAAQVCSGSDISYRFAGVFGGDKNGSRFRTLMTRAGFSLGDYTESGMATPSTDVLSDPSFSGGNGERSFINRIGAASEYEPEKLPADFFDADLLLLGGTALVPPLHDSLDDLCRRGRRAGAFVLVNTVFDFRSEARMKGSTWPLVGDYRNVDLLALDREEALKISGQEWPGKALAWFLRKGCGAVLITGGADDVLMGTGENSRFLPAGRKAMPTCRYVGEVLKHISHNRDTTGCGDNFVGGLLDSLARQMQEDTTGKLNLEDAVAGGIVAGAFALTCLGGVYHEEQAGQKRASMKPFIEAYQRELGR